MDPEKVLGPQEKALNQPEGTEIDTEKHLPET